jgi:type I restriction enzyme S subunit
MPEADNTQFPPSWQLQTLENCMSAIIDYRGKSPSKTLYGIPLITAKVVKAGRILAPDEFIAIEDYAEWMRRGIPQPGDIVMTTEAPLGEVAQLGDQKVALAQRLITLRGKPGLLDNTFLKFLMQSQFVQDELRARATGTTVLGIRQSELRKILLPIPPIQEQERIAEILGSLDDKIELNRSINETLEATAHTIFTLWLGALEAFQEDNFSRIATISRDSVNPSDAPTEVFDHYSIPAYDETRLPVIEQGAQIKSNKFIVHSDSVLLSKLNPRIPRIWMPKTGVERRSICSTEFLVLRPTEISSREFIYGYCNSPEFQDQFATMVTGTSGSHQRVQPDYLERMEIGLPPVDLVHKYTETVKPLHKRYASNLSENLTLAILRDVLLPKLVSGKLRVRAKEGS